MLGTRPISSSRASLIACWASSWARLTLPSECAFCQIVLGDQQAYLAFEDDASIAFLDVRPVFQGHVLLIPREHHATMMDLPAELGCRLFANAQLLARAVERAMEAE